MTPSREPLRALRVALSFLTTLPVGAPHDWRDDDLRRAVAAYPLVGLTLGLLLALAGWALTSAGAGALLGAALLLALWALLTGGLHFDGLLDLADAALAPRPPAER